MSDGTARADRPAFNAASETTLQRAIDVSSQRGGEYLDSWHVDNQVSTFLNHVLSLPTVPGREREYKRLLMVAALIDVKDSRMGGPWKLDTVDDGINYRGAFATWREEYAAYMGGAHAGTATYPEIDWKSAFLTVTRMPDSGTCRFCCTPSDAVHAEGCPAVEAVYAARVA